MNPLPDPQPAGGIDAEGAEAPTVGEAGVAATTEQQAQAQVGVATAAQPSAQLTREQALLDGSINSNWLGLSCGALLLTIYNGYGLGISLFRL